MEAVVSELIKQVPSLAVLVFMTIKFLEQQKSEREATQAFLASMADDCHAVHRESTRAVKQCSRIMGRVLERVGLSENPDDEDSDDRDTGSRPNSPDQSGRKGG